MQYPALKKYVLQNGGPRVAFRRDAAMKIVDELVEEWPESCHPAHIAEVMQAKMAIRTRRKYGTGILAMFVISVLVNHIVRLVVEWWLKRNSHKVLMEGWSRRAKEAQDVPPA